MRSISNECGTRNSFGYYDRVAKEIILKRPCKCKIDIDETLSWLDSASDLVKFAIGIGAVENFVIDDYDNGQYSAARNVIKQSVYPSMAADNSVLYLVLEKLQDKKEIRNICLKCYIFAEDNDLFSVLLDTIRAVSGTLVYLDLTGCYFTDEQLIDLAEVISQSHVANLVWPEPRMSQLVFEKVLEKFKSNRSLVVVRGMPLEMLHVASENRKWFFDLARNPFTMKDKQNSILREYTDSARLAIAQEKQLLMDLEKVIESVLV